MKNAATTKSIPEQLADEGLRLASIEEDGWNVLVVADNGSPIKVWATDAPAAKK